MLPEQISNVSRDQIDLIAIWRVVWRYKFVILGCTGVFAVIAFVMGRIAVPVFHAEVTITEVSDEKLNSAAALASSLGGLANLVGVNLSGASDNAREAQALLKSRRLAETFIVNNQLMPLMYPKPAKTDTLWQGVRHFREDILSIREDKRLGVIQVAINWTDPVVAARWANAYAGLANEALRARAIRDATASIEYLRGQIAQTNVVELQRALYNLVESQTKTLMLANARPEYAFTVVDPAVAPEEKSSPQRMLMLAGGILLGGLVGLTAAFVLNLMRSHKAGVRPVA